VNLLKLFYHLQSEYHRQATDIIQSSVPAIDDALDRAPRKFVFGTPLDEHIRCTGRKVSPVIEMCVYFLHSQGLQEEGLFRIPGSSVKIKKLKNGINALFLTLMNLNELENDQPRQSGHSCMVSLYDLFRSAVGQRSRLERQQSPAQADQPSFQNTVLRSSLAVEDSSMSNTNHGAQQESDSDDYIMDVNSIAGLLKLYLRELPEPLFTHALYDDWIQCASTKFETNEQRLESFAKILGRLPSANYANLRYLIKFLNKLSHYHEQNKMTSTNLAIAMAPSLIWSKPSTDAEPRVDTPSNSDDIQQMCPFGVSASQHAMILEALINNSDDLFPEPVDFELSEFANLNLGSSMTRRSASTRHSRDVKSTSPTALSTTSSSSVSSNASNSTAPTTLIKYHSRKGGSMEGLLGGQDIKGTLQPNMSTRSTGRPISVQMCRDNYSSMTQGNNGTKSPVPPPTKPPVPTARSHVKHTGDVKTAVGSSQRRPAPPVPPPTSVRHQQERLKLSAAKQASSQKEEALNKPQPVSLRGTGTISQTPTSSSIQSMTRPSVPPPERPVIAVAGVPLCETRTENIDKNKSVDDLESESANSLTSSSCNLRNDFEEISSNEVQEVEAVARASATVLSLDEVSTNDDSSFDDSEDDDNVSLDPSWTKCFKNCDISERDNGGTLKQSDVIDNESGQKAPKSGTSSMRDNSETNDVVQVNSCEDAKHPSNKTRPELPVKSIRSASPKLTQSTPL
jgi:hypothetical protein